MERIQQNIWHAALRILVLLVLHAFVQPTERERAWQHFLAQITVRSPRRIIKMLMKLTGNEPRPTTAKAQPAGAQRRAREAHRDPPETSPKPTSALGRQKKATNRKKYLLKIKKKLSVT